MIINVTQEDIDKATESRDKHEFWNESWNILAECPIARASSKALNKECWSNYACVHNPADNIIFFFNPKDVILWIEAFDAHEPVKPFSFDVELEQE